MAKNTKNKLGFSLVELIVAIGIFVIIIGGMSVVASGNYLSSFENQERFQANTVLTETWEALKAVRNNNWSNITNGTHGLTHTNGYWQLSGAPDTYSGITRQITVSNIRRDNGGDIVTSGGDVDPDSKSVVIQLTWSPTENTSHTVSTEIYLHNYLNPSEWPPLVE